MARLFGGGHVGLHIGFFDDDNAFILATGTVVARVGDINAGFFRLSVARADGDVFPVDIFDIVDDISLNDISGFIECIEIGRAVGIDVSPEIFGISTA